MSNLSDNYNKNFENYKIGFCVTYKCYQDFVCSNIFHFKEFINNNIDFINSACADEMCLFLDDLTSLFLLHTNTLYKNVDRDEKYYDYLKEFN